MLTFYQPMTLFAVCHHYGGLVSRTWVIHAYPELGWT